MHPLKFQNKIAIGLLGSQHAGGNAGAINFAVLGAPRFGRGVDIYLTRQIFSVEERREPIRGHHSEGHGLICLRGGSLRGGSLRGGSLHGGHCCRMQRNCGNLSWSSRNN